MEQKLTVLANRIRALAQNGLVYAQDEYNQERYEELLRLSHAILAAISGRSEKEIALHFPIEKDYVTPKVDVRAVIFNTQEEILLVREKSDGLWSLPGGWADVGYSPGEVAIKEVKEESGLDVKPIRLLAVHDKKCHNHPPAMHYAYKIFIECEVCGGNLSTAFDIVDSGFFPLDGLPSLSTERILPEQILLLANLHRNPDRPVDFD